MTKSELVEIIYLKVNGGKATSQNSVKRIDVEYYAMAAVYSAWSAESKERIETSIRSKRANLPFEFFNFNELRIAETLTPKLDTPSNLQYIEVPMIRSVGNMLDWEVEPVKGFEQIYKIRNASDLQGIENTEGIIYAFYQRTKTSNRIYFVNLPQSCGVVFTAIQDLNQLGKNDIVPIPSDKEEYVIQTAVEFFTGQKMTPADLIVDQADIKNKVNASTE